MGKTQVLGNAAEEAAKTFLLKNGLSIQAENYRSKAGEIDIIAQDKDIIVFVEVRMRYAKSFRDAIESIDYHKQKKIIRTAEYYLQEKRLTHTAACRFDVVASDGQSGKMVWLKDAFQAG